MVVGGDRWPLCHGCWSPTGGPSAPVVGGSGAARQRLGGRRGLACTSLWVHRAPRATCTDQAPNMELKWVRLFFVERFPPCSWAFRSRALSWVRRAGGQHSPPPVFGPPEQAARLDHDAWALRSAPPAHPPGHSRGVLVRFDGKGDASAMAVVTTKVLGTCEAAVAGVLSDASHGPQRRFPRPDAVCSSRGRLR